jgi:hypothetical protein
MAAHHFAENQVQATKRRNAAEGSPQLHTRWLVPCVGVFGAPS